MAFAEHGHGAYQAMQVQGADSKRLVILLFRGLLKFLARARAALEGRDYEAKAAALSKAQGILGELICSLDDRQVPELVRALRALYAHLQRELVEADLQDDLARLEYVTEMAQKLCDAWEEALQRCQEQAAP